MLETYFTASTMLEHLRSGPSGPYLDGFAAVLERQGYSADTAVRYLRAAAHLGHVVARQGALPDHIDLAVFSEHLCTCRCPRAMGGRGNHHTIFGARLFRRHLVAIGVCRSAAAPLQHAEPCLVAHFKAWLRKHRGASDSTVKLYARDAARLMAATRGRSRKVGTGRYSQLLPGPREPLRQWNGREVDDEPARVLALSCCQRPLPNRSRRCHSSLCPLAACGLAAISGGGAGEPADCGIRRRSRRAPAGSRDPAAPGSPRAARRRRGATPHWRH